jgi:type IV pilus assembly protein PilE
MRQKHNKGFTLIELMIVVALIGIISTVAVNAYIDNVIASKRSEARAGLTATAASLEKCKSLYGAYDHANCNVLATITTETNLYSIDTTTTRNATTFTLVATAIGSQVRDGDCATLSLDNTGVKTATGVDTTDCW